MTDEKDKLVNDFQQVEEIVKQHSNSNCACFCAVSVVTQESVKDFIGQMLRKS